MNDWFNEMHQTCIKQCYEQYKLRCRIKIIVILTTTELSISVYRSFYACV